MKDIIIYLARASVAMMIFYGFYWILLRRDTFFQMNRWYLLSSAGISLVIPLLNWNLSPAPLIIQQYFFPEVSVGPSQQKIIPGPLPDPYTVALLTWLSGALFFLVRLGIRLTQIFRILRGADRHTCVGFTLVFVRGEVSPFSFFRFIFLPENFRKNIQQNPVFLHEQVHARQYHTADLLLSELLITFFWFNPVVYLINHSLKSMHEFLADEAVLQTGFSVPEYHKLILRSNPGIRLNTIAPNFNVSLLKNRLIMMTKMRSASLARIKVILALPLFLLMVFFLSGGSLAQDTPQAQERSTAKIEKSEAKVVEPQNKEDIYRVVEKQPQYPGGEAKLIDFLVQNLKYPDEAKNKGLQGRVFVTFVVRPDGSVTDVKVIRGIGGGCDEEAVRVVKLMPNWIPGEEKGKKVNVAFNLPIKFTLREDKGKVKEKEKK